MLLNILMTLSFYGFSQQTVTKNLIHDNMNRAYIVYIPDSYNDNVKTSLLFNFHGYTSNAAEQMAYGNFRSIADEEGFILVHPEGALFNGQTHWNVGGWTIGSTVDDVGFTDAMITELSSEFNIDQSRIYATGMSNGGFMSFLLACQLSDKIAAIASVTGSMTPSTYNNCNAQHPTPILYIHGDSDSVVPYNGAAWTKKVEDVIHFWKTENECDFDAVVEDLPDTNGSDGSTVELFSYLNGESNSEVIHYKIIGGGHTWPGTVFNAPGTNQDFNASEAIWNFLSQYDINGLIDISTSIEVEHATNEEISIYPNPAITEINVDFRQKPNVDYQLWNLAGELILNGKFTQKQEMLDLSGLANGKYTLQIGKKNYNVTKINK